MIIGHQGRQNLGVLLLGRLRVGPLCARPPSASHTALPARTWIPPAAPESSAAPGCRPCVSIPDLALGCQGEDQVQPAGSGAAGWPHCPRRHQTHTLLIFPKEEGRSRDISDPSTLPQDCPGLGPHAKLKLAQGRLDHHVPGTHRHLILRARGVWIWTEVADSWHRNFEHIGACC